MDLTQKDIKVYGTLVNHTADPNDPHDTNHNGYIAYAYQLYDNRFGATGVNNYQDIINKRVTKITYNPSTNTTSIAGNVYIETLLSKLGDLSDVTFTNLASGNIIKYNGSAWVNATLTAADLLPAGSEGAVLKYTNGVWVAGTDSNTNTLAGLTDTNVSGATATQFLRYDSSNKWSNYTLTSADVIPNGTTNGQVLKWNGSAWIAGTDNNNTTLAGLSDTTISSPSSGQLLKHNGTNWVNASLTDVLPQATASGLVIKWNGSAWTAQADATGSGGTGLPTGTAANQLLMWNNSTSQWNLVTLDDILKAAFPSATSGQVVSYNGTNWTVSTPASGGSGDSLWEVYSGDNNYIIAKNSKGVIGNGFYDSSITMPTQGAGVSS